MYTYSAEDIRNISHMLVKEMKRVNCLLDVVAWDELLANMFHSLVEDFGGQVYCSKELELAMQVEDAYLHFNNLWNEVENLHVIKFKADPDGPFPLPNITARYLNSIAAGANAIQHELHVVFGHTLAETIFLTAAFTIRNIKESGTQIPVFVAGNDDM